MAKGNFCDYSQLKVISTMPVLVDFSPLCWKNWYRVLFLKETDNDINVDSDNNKLLW